MEKSPVKTMISQSGRHIVSELNKEVEKIDKRIAELIKSDEELTEAFTIVTSVHCLLTSSLLNFQTVTLSFYR